MEIYLPTSKRELSLRKQQAYEAFSKVVNWGRCNPVKFCEVMFGIHLMDFQIWTFLQSWCRPNVVWLMSRAAGKTVLASVYFMAKLLLIPDYTVYIGATTAEQAVVSFTKLEEIATNRIASFKDMTDVFKHELVAGQGGRRFKHNPAGYSFELFNGSSMQTLTSNEVSARGKRGSVWQDECGFQPKSFIDVCDQFANVDSNFASSTGILLQQPRQMPLQLLYTSSASSVSTAFYDKFRSFTKHMLAGDPNYFTCDYDIDFVLNHSSFDGVPCKSHITKSKVEADIRDNPESAERELFNHFRQGAGKHAVVTEDCLVRNSYTRLPVFANDTGKRKFIFCYDPARNYDNSILAIFELLRDDNVGYYLDLVNVISMVNSETDKKTPLNYVDQLKVIREAMIAYNGPGAAEWENIELYIDAGSGGAPRSGIADQLLFPWTDAGGVEHRGIIDPDDPQYETDRRKHPNNARIVHLLEPRAVKSEIFGALSEMADLNLIHFTQYDGYRDYLMVLPEEQDENDEIKEYKKYMLSDQEKVALMQIELAKTEVSYMCRYENPKTRTISYGLSSERRYTMHDDRAYTVAMGAYALWKIRNNDLRNTKRTSADELCFRARVPKRIQRKEDIYGRNFSR